MSLPVHHPDTLPPQQITDLFKKTFFNELYGDLNGIKRLVQSVKSDLYNRDYTAAFDSNTKRAAYCCRWSPARAVAYASLFAQLESINQVVRGNDNCDQKVLCIGGGAGGELVALASIFTLSRHLKPLSTNTLHIHLVDIYNWVNVISRLQEEIHSNWLYNGLSKFFQMEFTTSDVFKLDPIQQLQLNNLDLITLLFTTNELFSQNKTATIEFLHSLTTYCKQGCLFLITESAGSYSYITVGSKKFPIQFLIDTVLLGKKDPKVHNTWTLLDHSDSIWYRGDSTVDYPLKLENMRCFYRLYKKL